MSNINKELKSHIATNFDKEKLDELIKVKPDEEGFVRQEYEVEDLGIDEVIDHKDTIELTFATPLWYGHMVIKPTKEQWEYLAKKAVDALFD